MKVLVVDDNAMNLKLARLLVAQEGYDVTTVSDAHSALDEIGRDQPDLILLDIQMPDMDGLELTRRLKRDPQTADIPVVAVTASVMQRDEDGARAAGCVGFLRKPLDTRTFGAELRTHIR